VVPDVEVSDLPVSLPQYKENLHKVNNMSYCCETAVHSKCAFMKVETYEGIRPPLTYRLQAF
jgi:hypothetical protein